MSTQRILVPLDFSAEADRALAYAIAVAPLLQAQLIVCHVVPTLPLSTARLLAAIVEVEEEARPALATRLQQVHAAGVEGTALLLSGVPAPQILATATAQQVHLIIVATHERSPLQHALSDSVTTQLVRDAPCAVLVLPPRYGLTLMCTAIQRRRMPAAARRFCRRRCRVYNAENSLATDARQASYVPVSCLSHTPTR
jgi:nucleotide-binding universal stress UspA family protein